jgi:hypothetical protein
VLAQCKIVANINHITDASSIQSEAFFTAQILRDAQILRASPLREIPLKQAFAHGIILAPIFDVLHYFMRGKGS